MGFKAENVKELPKGNGGPGRPVNPLVLELVALVADRKPHKLTFSSDKERVNVVNGAQARVSRLSNGADKLTSRAYPDGNGRVVGVQLEARPAKAEKPAAS